MIGPHHHLSRLTGAIAGLVGAVALAPAAAQATTTTPALSDPAATLAAANCADTANLTTPFTLWGDAATYRLVPGGSFSTGDTSWTLSGGATTAATSAVPTLAGASGGGELVLPVGASATSPYSCVDPSQPTMRFMITGTTGAIAVVTISSQDSTGAVTTALPGLALGVTNSWQPTPIFANPAAVNSLYSKSTVAMSVTITVVRGTVDVDDVFVDPRMRA